MVLRGLWIAAFASAVLALTTMGNAAAQDQVAPGLSAADVDRNSPPYLTSIESRVTVRPDRHARFDRRQIWRRIAIDVGGGQAGRDLILRRGISHCRQRENGRC